MFYEADYQKKQTDSCTKRYFHFVHKYRYIIVLLTLGLMGFLGSRIFYLKTPDEQPQVQLFEKSIHLI